MAKLEEEIMKTILGMKRIITGDQDSSDPDEPYLQQSNRGNKLKRKANYIQDGQCGRTKGPKIYKATVEHAGYRRNILHRNPKRYDQDGIELSDSDEDGEANTQAAEENPYTEIKLDSLLLPLVSAASLQNHPSLSIAYTSPMLTDMAQQSYEMVQRERKSLNSAKQMLTKFRGDETWMPCGLLYSEEDQKIFDTVKLYPNSAPGRTPQVSNVYTVQGITNGNSSSDPSFEARNGSKTEAEINMANGNFDDGQLGPVADSSSNTKHTSINGVFRSDNPMEEALAEMSHKNLGKEHPVDIADSRDQDIAKQVLTSGDADRATRNYKDEIFDIVDHDVSKPGQEDSAGELNQGLDVLLPNIANGVNEVKEGDAIDSRRQRADEGDESRPGRIDNPVVTAVAKDNEENLENDGGSRPPPRRMRTRAQAQAASEPAVSSRTETPDAWVPPEIHPLFLIPEKAIPDKNYGLPPSEAEETRRLLMAYVQKQEEVVRGAEKLYEGLMQAERQRKTVFRWCKAEGHVGEMSDGEDWYDKDEWGLEDNLRKGHNDEEEDTTVAGKKTRGRRA